MTACPECNRLQGRMAEATRYVTHVASKNVVVKGRFKKQEAAQAMKKALADLVYRPGNTLT